MKAPRARWSGVIFITRLRPGDGHQSLCQEHTQQGQKLRSLRRCYWHPRLLVRKEVGVATDRLRTWHAYLLRDGERREPRLARNQAQNGGHANPPARGAESPLPSSLPLDLPSSRSAAAPAYRPAGG